jgi:hypothetical protein
MSIFTIFTRSPYSAAELGDDRRDLAARRAPLGPEIDDRRLVGLSTSSESSGR